MGLFSTTSIRYSIGAILLALMLALSACGGDEPDPVVETEPAAEVVEEPASDAAVDAEAEAVDAEVETDVESETTVQDVQVVTDTAIITETEVVTQTDILTNTEVTEIITETRVIVEQDVETDTEVEEESATITDSEVMTDVEEVEGEAVDATPEQAIEEAESQETITGTTGTTDTTDTTVTAVGFVDAQDWTMRASTLLDHDFSNQDGEVSGELEDLLIDTSSGRVLFASVEYGGFLDLGDKDIVVPLNALQWGADDQLILTFNEQELENFPDLGNNWPVISEAAWDDDVSQFWNNVGINANVDFQEASDSVIWASNLIGNSLGDIGAGEGSVEDILVDLSTGQVRYAIVDFGDGEGQVLLPMQAITVQHDGDNQILMLNESLNAEAIQSAPRITEDQYPADQPMDSTQLYEETDPFWEDWGF